MVIQFHDALVVVACEKCFLLSKEDSLAMTVQSESHGKNVAEVSAQINSVKSVI
jgi:hypothetical protein